ncbi:hypothetical protein AAC387_Pa06g0174 [Persea americana]
MVELDDSIVGAGPLGNCNVDAVSVQNHCWKNGNGIFLDRVRFKRQSISAKRDFPPRCGRNPKEPDDKLHDESLIARAARVGSLAPSSVCVESESPNLSKGLDKMESFDLLDGTKLETVGVPECLNQTSLLEPLNISKSDIANRSEMMKMMGCLGLKKPSCPEKDTIRLLDISSPGEAAKKIVPKKFPTRRVSCIRDFPRGFLKTSAFLQLSR